MLTAIYRLSALFNYRVQNTGYTLHTHRKFMTSPDGYTITASRPNSFT
jgi:hypothetical protein